MAILQHYVSCISGTSEATDHTTCSLPCWNLARNAFFMLSGMRQFLILHFHYFLRCIVNVGQRAANSYFVLFFFPPSQHQWEGWGGKVNGSLAPLNSRSTFWAGFILGTRCVMNTFLLPFNCGHLQQCYSNGGGIIVSLTRKSKRPSQSWSQMDSLKLMRLTVGMSPLCDRRLKGDRHFNAVSIGGAQNNSKCRRRGKVDGLGGVVAAGGDKSCQIARVKRFTRTIITIPIKIYRTFLFMRSRGAIWLS